MIATLKKNNNFLQARKQTSKGMMSNINNFLKVQILKKKKRKFMNFKFSV